MDQIDSQQLNKLLYLLEKNNIKISWILNICKINVLTDLNTKQYNFLLLLIEFLRNK